MKTDYHDLKDRRIKFINASGKIQTGKVIDAHYHVGITVVDATYPTDKLICLNKKIHYKSPTLGVLTYRQAFHYLIKQIQAGRFDVNKYFHVLGRAGKPSNVLSCAFE